MKILKENNIITESSAHCTVAVDFVGVSLDDLNKGYVRPLFDEYKYKDCLADAFAVVLSDASKDVEINWHWKSSKEYITKIEPIFKRIHSISELLLDENGGTKREVFINEYVDNDYWKKGDTTNIQNALTNGDVVLQFAGKMVKKAPSSPRTASNSRGVVPIGKNKELNEAFDIPSELNAMVADFLADAHRKSGLTESITTVPELEPKDKVVGTTDMVTAKAKMDSEKNDEQFEKETIDVEKFDRKDFFNGAKKQPLPKEAEEELKKINLDESLFEDAEDDYVNTDETDRKFDALAQHNFEYALDSEELRQKAIDDCNQVLNVLNNVSVEDIENAADEFEDEEFEDESVAGEDGYYDESYDRDFAINYTSAAMLEQGLFSEINSMRERALTEDWKAVCDEFIQKCNRLAEEYDDDYIVEGLEFVTQGLNFEESRVDKKALEDKYLDKLIRIHQMINPDSDVDDSHYNGKEGVVEYIDDMGQLHGTWGGLAVIPDIDDVEVIE